MSDNFYVPSPDINYADDGRFNNVRITAVNRFGKPWFELTDFTLNDAKQTFNQPDTASFTISPLHPAAEYLPLKVRNFEIKIDLPEWDNPIWGEPVSVRGGPNGITFQVIGHMGMFMERFIDRESKIYTSYQQADIMKELIQYAQNEEHQLYRNMNIGARILDFGIIKNKKRSRRYFREEHDAILDILQEFATTDTPVDMKMSYFTNNIYGAGTWTRFLDIIPRYDIIWPLATPLYFGLDSPATSNITSFEWSEDASALATDIYVGGGSSGDIRFEGHYIDQDAAKVHYARQAVANAGDETDPEWLLNRAKFHVNARKRPIQKITMKSVTALAGIGRYAWPGTIWPIKIDYGRIQVNGNFRIISRSYAGPRLITLELDQMTQPITRPFDIFGVENDYPGED